jgi:hypothetical protein
MTTPTDWRALCAELVTALRERIDDKSMTSIPQYVNAIHLIDRTNTALAQPEPQGPKPIYRYSPVTIAECGGPCAQGPEYCDCGQIKGEPELQRPDRNELGDAIRRAWLKHGQDSWCSIADDVLAELPGLARPEPQGSATLNWSEERQPCEQCRYNHCIAETPFGRFLISWKGWKDYPAVTVDEAPFGEWFECWNSVEKAKSACQAEYNRRLAAAVGSLPSQPEPQGATDEELEATARAAEILSMKKQGGLTSSTLDGIHAQLQEQRLAGLRAVATRYGRPAIEPVPVAERLPGPEDCDGDGYCWWWDDDDDMWRLSEHRPRLLCWTHWLPYWALPRIK